MKTKPACLTNIEALPPLRSLCDPFERIPMSDHSTKIIVGIDSAGAYAPALGLLQRLRFPNPRLTLLHVAAERLPFAPVLSPGSKVEEEYAKVVANLGHAALHDAASKAGSQGDSCDSRLVHGNPAERLIREAEAVQADLVVVNSVRHGVARSSYIGSVSRALAVGSRASVLIAKGENGRRSVFRAVFATDHSPFAQRCLERFLELRPAGLDEVHVVSAWEIDDREAQLLGQNLAKLGGDAERWIEESVSERNAEVCAKLEAAGYRTGSVVLRGKPNDAIHHAMEAVRADLLIVGSQGSGAMERTLVGSVSLHQAVAEFYPVLIVRP